MASSVGRVGFRHLSSSSIQFGVASLRVFEAAIVSNPTAALDQCTQVPPVLNQSNAQRLLNTLDQNQPSLFLVPTNERRALLDQIPSSTSTSLVSVEDSDGIVPCLPAQEVFSLDRFSEQRHRKHQRKTVPRHDPRRDLRTLSSNETALFDAVTADDVDMVEQLLQSSDVDGTVAHPRHGGSILHVAAEQGAVAVMQFVLQHGHVDVNARAANDSTALHWSCGAGQTDSVELLLRHGANVTIESCTWALGVFGKGSGQLASHWAAESGHLDCLQLLHDFDPLCCLASFDERDQTPADLASKSPHIAQQCIDFLARKTQQSFSLVRITAKNTQHRVVAPSHTSSALPSLQ